MFLTIKLDLHLNCVIMLNWIVWNGIVFDIETLLRYMIDQSAGSVEYSDCFSAEE